MKVKSEEQLKEAIELARKHGSITFLSGNPQGDRQKIYRILNADEPMPLFKDEYAFTVRCSNSEVTIEKKTEDLMLFVKTTEKLVVVEKPKKQPKQPEWLGARLELIEEMLLKLADAPKPDAREFFDTQRIAVQYYIEQPSIQYEAVIRQSSYGHEIDRDDFNKKVIEAFAPQHAADAEAEPSLDDRIKLNAKLRGETEDQRELDRLLKEHEHLIKLKDQGWSGPDILG